MLHILTLLLLLTTIIIEKTNEAVKYIFLRGWFYEKF